jgi:acetyl-CoA C-acetyltransferase
MAGSQNRVAIVGMGQTKHAPTRGDVSMAGLLREAAGRALADAEMAWTDIDAVVVGKAPDFFEGVMMPELFLADALGAVGKPLFRVHTAGSVGGSTAIVASQLVAAGIHERVLTVAFEKQSESNAMWALSMPIPFQPPLHAGAGGYFAPHIRSYMRRSKAPDHIGILVALKDRTNALKNPYAHLHQHEVSFDSIKDSIMLWDPIRYEETCPSSDGAFAIVFGSEKVGDEAAAQGRTPAWLRGTSMRSEPTMSADRDTVLPLGGALCAKDVYRQAGITDPRRQVDCVEMYVPFSWFEPMWLENLLFAEPGEGWRMVEDGVTQIDSGDLPVNMSGGVLSTNPIGASGMIRFGEAAMQVRGQAGEHQIDGARLAVGHAYGGGSQFFAMWVVGREKP